MRKYNRKNTSINGYSKNIENDTEIFLKPAFDNNNIALAMSSSNEYAPYVSVLIQSIIDNAKAAITMISLFSTRIFPIITKNLYRSI